MTGTDRQNASGPDDQPRGPFAQLVRDMRRSKSLSLTDVARRMNRAAAVEGETTTFNRFTVHPWERETIPRPDSLRWLAAALELPISQLLDAAHAQRQTSAPSTPTTLPLPAAAVDSDEEMQRRQFLIAVVGLASGADLLAPPANLTASHLTDEAIDLAAWLEQTTVADRTVTLLAQATHRLAENHTRVPPRPVLADVLTTHRHVQALLRHGKPRLRQARELFKIEADLLAHACIPPATSTTIKPRSLTV